MDFKLDSPAICVCVFYHVPHHQYEHNRRIPTNNMNSFGAGRGFLKTRGTLLQTIRVCRYVYCLERWSATAGPPQTLK